MRCYICDSAIAPDDIDFDFESGEIIQDPPFDVIDFRAKISHHCGQDIRHIVTINHWVKIPRSLKVPLFNRIRIKQVGDVPCSFPARVIPKTRRPWDGRPPVYVHESL